MASKMIVALLVVFPFGAMAGSCAAGYKFKASLNSSTCSSSSASQATCMNCCEADVKKCGGNTVACATGFYQDSTKGASLIGSDKGVTSCCTAKAKCADYTCPEGKNKNMVAKECAGASATCGSAIAAGIPPAVCCTPDKRKCGGNSITCGDGKYQDKTKDLKSTKSTMAQCSSTDPCTTPSKIADCCSVKASCSALSLCKSSFMVKDTSKDLVQCSGAASSCTDSACCMNGQSDDKCGANKATITCDNGTSITATSAAVVGKTKALCCVTTPTPPAKATCTAFAATTTTTPTATSNSSSPTSGAQKLQSLPMNVILAVSLMAALWK